MSAVLCEVQDGIATLTLNLPHKLNPIAAELQQELRAALSRACASTAACAPWC